MPEGTQLPAGGIDPNVVMPPHVKAAIEKSTTAHAATYAASGNGEAQPPANGTQGPPAATPGVAAAAQPAPAAPPAPTPPVELSETNDDGTPNWENRFKALKGRFEATQRQHTETIDQINQRIREMQREQPRQLLPGESDQFPQLVSAKEVEDYGADLIDVMKRVATEAVMPLLKPIATTVGQVQARVETTADEASKQFLSRMNSAMDNRVPGWQDLNQDPNFIAWTKRNDVYSGLNRQELLQKAWYAGDSNRVAAFFEGFLAEEAAVDPAAAQARQQAWQSAGGHAAQPPASSAPTTAPRVTLEQLAAPGRARAAATAPVGTRPVWTAEGISQFYMDCARGVFNGREAERLATEADLMAAQREGRIQVNPRTATRVGG